MKIFSSFLIIIAAFAVGIFKAREEKRKCKTLHQLRSFLELIKNEICTNKTKLNKLFNADNFKQFTCICGFISSVGQGLNDLDYKRFSDIWIRSADENLEILPARSMDALKDIGASIGKYDSSVQKEAIDRCMDIIKNQSAELDGTLKNNEKMYIGLGGGAGMILALVLI